MLQFRRTEPEDALMQWEANSCVHDGESPFCYKIKKLIRHDESGKVYTLEDSDSELLADDDMLDFPSLNEAKHAAQEIEKGWLDVSEHWDA